MIDKYNDARTIRYITICKLTERSQMIFTLSSREFHIIYI